MAQWINILWKNSFINPMRLPLLCRNSRAVALAEPGLMAGWMAGWLADKMHVNFKFFEIHCRSNVLCLTKLQHY